MKAASASIPPAATAATSGGYSPAGLRAPALRGAVGLVAAYLRSQLVALLATAVDFAALVALVEGLHVHYVAATALGAISGGVTAFVGNRHYSFVAGHGRVGPQSVRYALVWLGSLTLNCVLVWAMTEGGAVPYTWSKVLTAIVVGAGFNFPLHRWYVFR